MRISASSMPASSSHFTISTMVRAGRAEVTAMRVRALVERRSFRRPRHGGRSPAATGWAHSISMVEWRQRALLNLARRADGDDAAFIHDGHAVAELFGLFDVVGGQQDGALLAAQVLHQFVDFEARLRIEAGGRLVEEEHLRIVEQRQRQRQALFLAAGELRIERFALLPKLQALEQLGGIHGAGVEGGEQLDGLADTLIFSCRLVACRQTPMRSFNCGSALRGRSRARRRARRSRLRRPSRISTVVVLPAPLGPSRPKTSPALNFEIDAFYGGDVA